VKSLALPAAGYRLVLTILANTLLVTAAYFAAFLLRFDLEVPTNYLDLFWRTLPWLLLCKLSVFGLFGLHQGWWRYITVHDLTAIVQANAIASLTFLLGVVFTTGIAGFPRSVFLLEPLLSVMGVAGVRVLTRMSRERQRARSNVRPRKRTLVIGAGDAGVQLLRELNSNVRLSTSVVGFVDDDSSKIGLQIHGVKVLGPAERIPEIVNRLRIDELLIAVPSARPKELRRILRFCQAAQVPYRALPSIGEIVTGKVIYTQIREVKVEDLLARDPVMIEEDRARAFIGDRTVLVTGAAGSIGSELCRQLARHGARSIVGLERNEGALFALQGEFALKFPNTGFIPVLGDLTSEALLQRTFATHAPRLVLHAGAYKHVPMAELNVIEATRNNILGTAALVRATLAANVEDFVMISTDKAVKPESVMGVTKRIAELVVQSSNGRGCKFVSVRFGNVLGSSGSVVPIFREQIARGGPVTVTHPEIQRFFMTIPEAALLILQAAALGNGGEIFVLEMGVPVKIVDLARNMIRLSGYEPDEDIPIVFTGLRPGEKMSEELMNSGELVAPTSSNRIKVLTSAPVAAEPIAAHLAFITSQVAAGNPGKIIEEFARLIPDYRPSDFVKPPTAMVRWP